MQALRDLDDEVWGHSVGELCEDAKSFDEEFKKIETASKSLDKYWIPTIKIIDFIKLKTGGEQHE